MAEFFKFESDFVDSLRCIPMQVRYKLDTCGVKLKLEHWHQFSQAEREMVVGLPCETPREVKDYCDRIQSLVEHYNGSPAKTLDIDPHPAWLDSTTIPSQTQAKAAEFDTHIDLSQWQSLSPLQRFALIKLSRPSHENKNFLPALKEFNLLTEHQL